MTAGTDKQAVYGLYDRYHDALRATDSEALAKLYDPKGEFVLRGEGESHLWTTSTPLVDHLVARVREIAGPFQTGLDVYTVSLRGTEAIALIEEWIDNLELGRRRNRFAIETLRAAGDGSWRITRSISEETSSTLA